MNISRRKKVREIPPRKLNCIHTNLTRQRTTKNSLSRAGFELASSGFLTVALAIELSSQLGLVASLIQFKCTKYFRDDLTLVFEDTQRFNSISEPFSEM